LGTSKIFLAFCSFHSCSGTDIFWSCKLGVNVKKKIFSLNFSAYKGNFELGESEYKQRNWYIPMLKTHMFLIFSEIVGLVLVSVVDIEEYFGKVFVFLNII